MKRYIISPGPVEVSPTVLSAMSMPIMHHRTPQFSEILTEVRENLKYLYQTNENVLFFASSGTGAMEAAVCNLLSKGDKAICIRAGKFGERWTELCNAFGVIPIDIDVTWGEAVDSITVKDILDKNPDVKAVFMQAHETSTGAKQPVKEIAEITKNMPETVLIIDAITALGVYELKTDEWGLDVVITGSQKALGLPPGLSTISVSQKAWKLAEKSDLPKFYFNLKSELKSYNKQTTSFTPAISLIIGLSTALKEMKERGLENVFLHHKRLAEGTRQGVIATGLELYSKSLSEAVTVIKMPEGIDGQKVNKILRDEFGISIAGGQGEAKGKIVRISHMGYLSEWDMIIALSAIERALKKLGHPIILGRAGAAALEYFAQN